MKARFVFTLLMLAAVCRAQESDPAIAPSDTEAPQPQNLDPFAPYYEGSSEVQGIPQARLSEARHSLRLRLEIWEMDAALLVEGLDRLEEGGDVGELRKQLFQREGVRLVHAPMLALEARSTKVVESIVEEIYPTEYEPPETLPGPAVEKILDEKTPESLGDVIQQLTTPAIGTAFETRNTGVTFEAEVQRVEVSGEEMWDISMSFEDVALVVEVFHGPEELNITMPVFGCFRCGGLQRVVSSRWHFVSAGPPANREDGKTWVALVRVDRAK